VFLLEDNEEDDGLGSKIKVKNAVCPVCGSTNIIFDPERGETICADCGTVISDKAMDSGQEWRAFTKEERDQRSRVGEPTIPGIGAAQLSTIIDTKDIYNLGGKMGVKKRIELQRVRKWQVRSRLQGSHDRNLIQALNELDRIVSQLGLPTSIRNEAAVIYNRAATSGMVRGRSIESVIAAAIYAACRKLRNPVSLDEISNYTQASRKDVARCYRLLLRENSVNVPVPDAVDYVAKIASPLHLSAETQKTAAEVIKKAQESGITAGKDPAGLAAAGIYIASLLTKTRRTQKEIAMAAQVTEVTVRNRYKEMLSRLNIGGLSEEETKPAQTEDNK